MCKRLAVFCSYPRQTPARRVTLDSHLGPLPKWLQRIATQLNHDGLIEQVPDQVIINEYEPGQGITKHIGCEPCFGDKIFSLSLGSHATFEFSQESKDKVAITLNPKSLAMMYGEARYDCKHGIPARKKDDRQLRPRRISLTFRKAIV